MLDFFAWPIPTITRGKKNQKVAKIHKSFKLICHYYYYGNLTCVFLLAVNALSSQASHHCDDLKRAKQMSSAFSSMYRSIIRLLQVNVNEVKDSLRYLTDPRCLDKLCVPPKVYKDTTSTKDLLRRLCPRYINPKDTFVLEEIVSNFGSQRCKRLLSDYTDKFNF